MSINLRMLASTLQSLLTTRANELARLTGLVQRERKLTGSLWVQTLVFGFLEQPQASLEDLTEWLDEHHEVQLTPQALHDWFCPAGTACLKELLPLAVGALVDSPTLAVPLLERFQGVYVEDGTTVALPAGLAAQYPGCGGSEGDDHGDAALKIFVRMELGRGAITDLVLAAGRQPDVSLGQQVQALPAGALRLKDLGFFDTALLAQDSGRGVHWISRLPSHVKIRVGAAAPQALPAWLQQQGQDEVDLSVAVGVEQPLACRLLAWRCPEEVRQRRLRKLEERMSKKGRPVTERQRLMCSWTVLITDLPAAQLSPQEGWALYRARWQIELLFKLWKSEGRLAESLGHRDDRALGELLAKLLGVLVQHWLLLLAGPWLEDIAWKKRLRRLRYGLYRLVVVLGDPEELVRQLEAMQERLRRLRHRGRRKKQTTLNLLKEPWRAKLSLN